MRYSPAVNTITSRKRARLQQCNGVIAAATIDIIRGRFPSVRAFTYIRTEHNRILIIYLFFLLLLAKGVSIEDVKRGPQALKGAPPFKHLGKKKKANFCNQTRYPETAERDIAVSAPSCVNWLFGFEGDRRARGIFFCFCVFSKYRCGATGTLQTITMKWRC